MENTIILDGDKSHLHISDSDGMSVSVRKAFGEPLLVVETLEKLALNRDGALALRDFLNQYLVGYE